MVRIATTSKFLFSIKTSNYLFIGRIHLPLKPKKPRIPAVRQVSWASQSSVKSITLQTLQ